MKRIIHFQQKGLPMVLPLKFVSAPFLANGLNKKLFLECCLPVTVFELVAKFSCFNTKNYVIGECSECSSTKFNSGNFINIIISDSDSASLSNVSDFDGEDENVNEDFLSYCECAHCKDNKLQNTLFKGISTSLFFCCIAPSKL